MEPIYLGAYTSKSDILSDFDITLPEDIRILFAATSSDKDWSGQIIVIFTDGKEYYEVNAEYWSGGDLSGQWQPEVLNTKSIRKRKFESIKMDRTLLNKVLDFIDKKRLT